MARPRKYESPAAKAAAYRARYRVIDVRLKAETVDTLDALAKSMDMPRNEVVHQLLQFALTNRAWHTAPRFTSLLPRAENPIGD